MSDRLGLTATARSLAAAAHRGMTEGTVNEASGESPRSRSALGVLAADPATYARRIAAYALAFMVVAGSQGSRIPMRQWLTAPGTSAADLLALAGVGLLVALAGAVVAAVAGNLPAPAARRRPHPAARQRPGRPSRWAGRWAHGRPWTWLLGLAVALGCAAGARLGNDAGVAVLPAAMVLAGAVLVGPVLHLVLARLGAAPARTMWIGLAVGAAALVLRVALPALAGGGVASGEVRLAGLGGVSIGELTRALAALGAALALTGARQQVSRAILGRLPMRTLALGLLGRLAPTLAMICALVVLEDLGPALILLATMAVLVLLAYPWQYWLRATSVAAALGIGAGALGWAINTTGAGPRFLDHAAEVVATRVDGDCSAGAITQACKSLRILHDAGLLPPLREVGSPQPMGSPLVRHLEVAASDYALTLLAGWVGMALVVLLLVAIMAVSLRIVLAATTMPAATEAGHMRLRVAATAGLQLLLPSAMLGLAVLLPRFPGTAAKMPLTGLDVPFIAANGTSALVYSAVLVVGTLMVRADDTGPPPPAPERNREMAARVATIGVPLVAATISVGAVWIHLGWAGAGSSRLAGESLLRDNHARLLARDGVVISEPNHTGADPDRSLGARLNPAPDLAVDLGMFRPGRSANEAVGLELLAAPLLTCGDHRDRGLLPIAARCSAADTIATVDSRVQRLAAGHADRRAAGAARADVVLVDRASGAIVALASSDADDPAMQQVITGAATTSGWRPPTLLQRRGGDGRDVEVDPDADPRRWAEDRAAFAMRHLKIWASQCVDPRGERDGRGDPVPPTQANPRHPREGWTPAWPEDLGPTRRACEADKQGLAIMRSWYSVAQPGSTFKVVTAVAAAETGTAMPPDSLGSPLEQVGGQPLEGSISERSTLARCGRQSIDWMLLQSCNTTAAWLGVTAGWSQLARAAGELGFGQAATSPGGAVLGPADPSAPRSEPGRVHYPAGTMGTDPQGRTAAQADGVVRPLTAGAVAFATGSAAIGQDQIRAGVLDLAALTHAVVGSGPLTSDDGAPSTQDQVGTQYVAPTALNMVAGACTPDGFEPAAYPQREVGTDRDALAQARRGMWWAVNHPDSATARALRPAGPDRRLGPTDVIWAKTGSAELGPSGGRELWARWVMGASDRYVFAARVSDYPDGGGANPAVGLIRDVLADVGNLPAPPAAEAVCGAPGR